MPTSTSSPTNDHGIHRNVLNQAVNKVLENLEKHHPAYDVASCYKVASFVWFQGRNDKFAHEFRDNYKRNLIVINEGVRAE